MENESVKERMVKLEVEMKNLQNGMDMMNAGMKELHGKFDTLTTMLTQNYVAKDTFEEYKKNRTLERILTILITSVISGLVAYFLRLNKF